MSLNIEKKSESGGFLVTCKRCGVKGLKWRGSKETPSGWELYDPTNGYGHQCTLMPKVSEKDRLLQEFLDNEVIWEKDSEEVKQKKRERQKRLRWNFTEGELIDMKIIHEQDDAFYRKRTFFS